MARTRKNTSVSTEAEKPGTPKRATRKPTPAPESAAIQPVTVETTSIHPAPVGGPATPPSSLLQELRETKESLLRLNGEWRNKLEERFDEKLGHSRAEVAELKRDLNALAGRVDELSKELERLKSRSSGGKTPADEESLYNELVKDPAEEKPAEEKPAAAIPAADSSPPPEGGWLGITVESAVVIADVLTGSPAASAGLLEGDVIIRVNGTPILEASALRALVEETAIGEEFILDVVREGKTQKVTVHFEPIASASTM